MRQKDTQRLLQMVETTARVPKLVWQDCTKEHGMVAEPEKDKQRLHPLLRCITAFGNKEGP